MLRIAPPLLSALAALLVSGCMAAGDGYPSLAPRAIESGDGSPAPSPAPTADPVDPALSSQIDGLRKQFDTAKQAFAASADKARLTIDSVKGAAPGTGAWLNAQTALGDLDLRHSATRDAAAAIETLLIERAAANQSVPAALETANDDARKEVERQTGIIDTLSAAIAAP